MDDRHGRLQADAFVAGQGLLLLALVAPGTSSPWRVPRPVHRAGLGLSAVGLGGMLVAASSLGKGLTASPLPNAAAQLRTGGLYSRVRHPIYSGLLLLATGRVLASPSPVRLAALGGLTVLLARKARWEERHLVQRFPDYARYAEATPRFVPALSVHRSTRSARPRFRSS
jgi:protein-S-isoprenylcysteine O-methyltransferase Ste14